MNTNYYAKLAKNKSLLKEYKTSDCDRTVYLEDGDEFQFQLFNPETTEICARIFIEDTQLSHDIVLRPGERLWLERYTDVSKKFKFVTYVVDGEDAQVKKAISHNGVIRILFFRKKEKPKYYNNYPNITWINMNTYEPIHTYDYKLYCDANNTITTGSCDTTLSCSAATLSCDNNVTPTSFSVSGGKTRSRSLSNVSLDAAPTTAFYNNSINVATPSLSTSVYNSDYHKDTLNLETGRISEGSRSKQKFETVNLEFESWAFKEETIKIFPLSRKPYNANDLKKLYCSNCGRKLNTKYKYCPYCGSKVE